MRKDLVLEAFTLANLILSLKEENKQKFLNFAQKMLQWLLEKRKLAKELLEDL